MINFSTKIQKVLLVSGAMFLAVVSSGMAQESARGTVFEDKNHNDTLDPGETGIAGVGVSNGRDVVLTDGQGHYQLSVVDGDVIFVVKPRNFLPTIDKTNLSRFYYVYRPSGSPTDLKYAGVAPTGSLPESINFPLTSHPEPDRFEVAVLGDPQPNNAGDIDFLSHDILEELIGTDAAFGVSLGDVMNEKLNLFQPYINAVSTVGIPWFNVPGNHDENYEVDIDDLANETWKQVFGPPTYSFNWGPVHFIVLDDVFYEGQKNKRTYHSEIGRHLTFIENDLKQVPKEALVVLMMHIPLVEAKDRAQLFDLLQDRPHTFSMSAHWHYQENIFMGEEHGCKQPEPHHHWVSVTACGSWWAGALDEFGIPHTMMRDGCPNGYSIVTFDGSKYSIRFKAARRPADNQMSIYAPDHVKQSETATSEVVVNVFAGSPRSVVEMRIDDSGSWIPLQHQTGRADPYYMLLKEWEVSARPPNGHRLSRVDVSPHLWAGFLPADLSVGGHVIVVRTRDMFDQKYIARRIINIEPD